MLLGDTESSVEAQTVARITDVESGWQFPWGGRERAGRLGSVETDAAPDDAEGRVGIPYVLTWLPPASWA